MNTILKRIEKNNIVLLFDFAIINNRLNKTSRWDKCIEFTIYLIQNNLINEFFKSFPYNSNLNLNQTFNIKQIVSLLISKLGENLGNLNIDNFIDYEYVMGLNIGLFNQTIMDLSHEYHSKNIGMEKLGHYQTIEYRNANKYDSNTEYLIKEHILQLYLNEIPTNNAKRPYIYHTMNFDIYEVINLLYYNLFEIYSPYRCFDVSWRYTESLLFHKRKSNDNIYQITPFFYRKDLLINLWLKENYIV